MAMMMTGRVLLVCALCVLWCGAGGGYAWDFNNDSLNEYYYGANGTYCKIFPKMYSCELKINASKREKAASQAKATQSGEGSGQSSAGGSSGRQDQTLEEGGLDQSEGATGPQAPQPPGEGGTETPTPTVTAAHSADGQDNSSEESHLGQPEGTAGEGTQASQPPGEGGTETPTPATATVTAAQTSDTRTPDESDGSTAASHTTSPLFLFLLACAAAAAVVAA
ncbi:Mucin-associated surface protein (MASP) [Trypanosoma cruzi]|uniref:Mucin-associated surface protein (MASP), putative n=2 Tax=Trypanosoma cruzi TaxID=5693 RepID=Q4E2D0_TRYCC|nr:mucin-associated surface protein (MASP), putative [Trypanosoma cruzi]EAN98943.1 mucin-associated surface protein (MASP), putative [Trypanosoma cruzi]PWV07855.1 Mucin-associated surface protein (MASP) [Trypanosoma cruzi]RNC57378.1 mucin-associated surface protein (MASP) [Trypanosoma cruzi]|eukprot:XP_820794.1 mucin-associated surface protein (MASP) [Trypanosoma cruzi strain CL Brener]